MHIGKYSTEYVCWFRFQPSTELAKIMVETGGLDAAGYKNEKGQRKAQRRDSTSFIAGCKYQ